MVYIFLSHWLHRPPKHYKSLPLVLVLLHNLTAEDTTYLRHRTQTNLAGTQLEASPLLASIHSARTCLLEEKSNHPSHAAMSSVSCNSDLPARCPHWCNSSMDIRKITNHFLVGFKRNILMNSSAMPHSAF